MIGTTSSGGRRRLIVSTAGTGIACRHLVLPSQVYDRVDTCGKSNAIWIQAAQQLGKAVLCRAYDANIGMHLILGDRSRERQNHLLRVTTPTCRGSCTREVGWTLPMRNYLYPREIPVLSRNLNSP